MSAVSLVSMSYFFHPSEVLPVSTYWSLDYRFKVIIVNFI